MVSTCIIDVLDAICIQNSGQQARREENMGNLGVNERILKRVKLRNGSSERRNKP